MTKKWIYLFIIAVMIASLSYYIYGNKHVFNEVPYQQGIQFENPSRFIADLENNVYVMDQSLKRIIKADSEGNLKYKIMIDEEGHQDFYLLKDFVVDEQGNLYVLRMALDEQGIRIKREEIVQYNSRGIYVKDIYVLDYDAGSYPTRPGRLNELNYRMGSLYFYSMNQTDVSLKKLLLNGDISEVIDITLPEDTYLAEIAGLDEDQIYYTTKRAEIFKVNSQGESILLLESNSQEEMQHSFPVYIDVDNNGNVYYTDLGRREINRFHPENLMGEQFAIETIVEQQDLNIAGGESNLSLTSAKSVSPVQQGSIIIGVKNSAVKIDSNGQVEFIHNQAVYSRGTVIFHWIIWSLAFITFILFLYMIKFIYFDMMNRKVSLIIKQLVIFVPMIVISLIAVASIVYINFSNKLEEEVFNNLKLAVHIGSQTFDKDRIEEITNPSDFMGESYRALDTQNHFMLNGNKSLETDALYSALYRVEKSPVNPGENQVYVLMYYNTSVGTYYPIDSFNIYDNVINEGVIETETSEEADGTWMYALGPIYNNEGQLIGMHEVGMTLQSFNEYKNKLFWTTGKVILIITPIILVVFLIMTFYLLSSIRTLRRSVNDIAQGNWGTAVTIESRDEVADLGNSFNYMSSHIRNYIAEINELSNSYYRFVPQQFLGILQKDSIMDVQLGDQVQQEMSVCVANIRNFYKMSKPLSPAESFNLINSFLNRIGPSIRKNEGMINRYLGAGILALFPGTPDEALKAAIDMKKELEIYNKHRRKSGYEPIDIGIGIHKGPLMLGIIGEEQRLEGSVISDDVNLAVQLEKLTEPLGASILITDYTFQSIDNLKKYQYRDLGLIQIEGNSTPMKLYDVYQGDSDSIRKVKQATKKQFEQAIEFYQDGRFYDGREAFLEVIKHNRLDYTAKLYFYLCDEYYQKGTSEGWDGSLPVSPMDNK